MEKGFEREVRMGQPPQETRPMPGGWGMNCWVQKTPQGGEAQERGIASRSIGPVLLWPHTTAQRAREELCGRQCLPGLAVW